MNQIKPAFDQIQADERLKQSTFQFVQKRMHKGKSIFLRYSIACATVLLVLLTGLGLYYYDTAPVSFISIDVNPSLELSLNRKDEVVKATAYNKGGQLILTDLSLKGKPYLQAIELLLASPDFAQYLSQDSYLSFTVISPKDAQIISEIEQDSQLEEYASGCSAADAASREEAHAYGLSFGKYRAYLELARYDDSITPEDCRAMSMYEIKKRIQDCQSAEDTADDSSGAAENCPTGSGGNSPRNGQGFGQNGHGYRKEELSS